MKRTLQRHKNKKYPKIPKAIQDIQNQFQDPAILNEYGINLEGDSTFYIDTIIEANYAFTVFGSQFTIDFIKENIPPESRNFLLDGTFDKLPGEFYQLLIVAIEYKNDVGLNVNIKNNFSYTFTHIQS